MRISILFTLLCVLFFGNTFAQQPTTLTSTGTTSGGSSTSLGNNYTFSVRNNNPIPMRITEIGAFHYGSGPCIYEMWYTKDVTQATGTTATIATPAWTNFGNSLLVPGGNGVKPYFQNISIEVPPNTTMRFAMVFPYTYNGSVVFRPSMTLTGGNPVSAGGMDLMSGSNSISNGLIGSGMTSSGTFNFVGYIIFEPAAIPCDDTVESAVVLGPTKICPNKPFGLTIGLKSGLLISGLTYQWQYSNNGTSWSNFTGAPNPVKGGEIIDSITQNRWYRCIIKCLADNKTYTTAPHKVSILPFYYCYCDNSVVSDAGSDIGNVTIINTNKFDTVYGKRALVTGTGLPVYSNTAAKNKYTGYHDSLAWPCLYRDTNYIFNVTQIHPGNTFETGVLQAYIDYNRDGLYNPVTERVFVRSLNGTGTSPHIAQIPVTIQSTAEIGPTGLRIIISKDTVKAAPCDTISGGGEVEDYIVEICYRPCDGPVNAGIVVSTDTSMCNGYEYTLTDTTYEKARSGFTRSWQVSGDNLVWQNINNSMGKDTLERIFGGQPLHYRMRTICLPTHDTNYSQSTFINVKPGYKCYCYSKAIGGKNVDTSDIGGVSLAAYSNNAGGPHLLNPVAMYPRTDYTDIDPIEVFTDSVYKFYVYHTMSVAEHGDAKVTIFMDFNNNHEYDIPQERIYTGYTTIGNHTLVDNVIVPTNAITDVPTGMRVIVNNNVGPNIPSDEACGPYISGETEDYLLVFRKKWGVSVNSNSIEDNWFNITPNPTNGKFAVQYRTHAEKSEIKLRVTTVSGQLVQEQSFSHEGGMFSKEMNISNQPAGVYFVELQSEGQKVMKKLVLQ